MSTGGCQGLPRACFLENPGEYKLSYTEVESVQKTWTFRHWIYSGRATYHWR